jgi:hypothetical protein
LVFPRIEPGTSPPPLTALLPQIPADYLIRKRNGRPYTEDGFSAIWQRSMGKHVKAGGDPVQLP